MWDMAHLKEGGGWRDHRRDRVMNLETGAGEGLIGSAVTDASFGTR
jgi:hypothetical protein